MFYLVDILGVDILGIDVMGVDILGIDIMGVDILGIDILALPLGQSEPSTKEGNIRHKKVTTKSECTVSKMNNSFYERCYKRNK